MLNTYYSYAHCSKQDVYKIIQIKLSVVINTCCFTYIQHVAFPYFKFFLYINSGVLLYIKGALRSQQANTYQNEVNGTFNVFLKNDPNKSYKGQLNVLITNSYTFIFFFYPYIYFNQESFYRWPKKPNISS